VNGGGGKGGPAHLGGTIIEKKKRQKKNWARTHGGKLYQKLHDSKKKKRYIGQNATQHVKKGLTGYEGPARCDGDVGRKRKRFGNL